MDDGARGEEPHRGRRRLELKAGAIEEIESSVEVGGRVEELSHGPLRLRPEASEATPGWAWLPGALGGLEQTCIFTQVAEEPTAVEDAEGPRGGGDGEGVNGDHDARE